MSPRVVPKIRPLADTLDEHNAIQAAHREAAHDFKLATDAALEEVTARHGIAFNRPGRSIYDEPRSPHSYFRDLALAGLDASNRAAGERRLADPLSGTPEDVQARLATIESRAMTTTATAGGNFVVNTAPRYISDAFAEAARAAAVLTTVLPVEPLPDVGMDIYTARITTGMTVGAQATQNTTVSNQDAVEAKTQTSPVAMIAGYIDVSIQLDERAEPAFFDVICARELGSALGAALDLQLLSGTGANGQVLGLTAVTSIGTTAYTDASPTQAECYPKIAQACGDLSVALGNTADAILMHPRRGAWFYTWKDSATGMQSNLEWPAPIVNVPSIPTTNGASTNEDFALAIRADQLPVYLGPVTLESFPDVGASTGTSRIVARQYAASLFARRPAAINLVSGTGFGGVTYA